MQNLSAQSDNPSLVSSEPYQVCFCWDNNTLDCGNKSLDRQVYPGEQIYFSAATTGQNNGIAPGVIKLQEQDSAPTSESIHVYNTDGNNCTSISFTPVHSHYSIFVPGTKYSQRHKILNFTLTECPLGLEISNKTNSRSCDCINLKTWSKSVTCDVATNTLARQGDTWIGTINSSDCNNTSIRSNDNECVIVQTPCPFDYCDSTTRINFTITDPDQQCALNRTGILCGQCRTDFSLMLGSNRCKQCNNLQFLSLIIFFAAAGPALVALLMILNLTVSVGTINGLIFYASIVKISESSGIFFPNGSIPVLSQFIAWLNLDLGIETCFYDGMKAYAKVWLQFAFPLYIWFIIATIIILCRYSKWLSNKIGGNVVQVLATLILLSFIKIFRNFIPALTWIPISCVNEKKNIYACMV